MNEDMQTITFQGNQILTVEQKGIHYAAMKPICESIGGCGLNIMLLL